MPKIRRLPTKKIDAYILMASNERDDVCLKQVAPDVWVYLDIIGNRIPNIIIFGKHCQNNTDYISFNDLIKYAHHFIEGPNPFDWDTDVDSYSIRVSLDLTHGCSHWIPDALKTLYCYMGAYSHRRDPFNNPDDLTGHPYYCLTLTLEDYHS
jgi:hypothetical protein